MGSLFASFMYIYPNHRTTFLNFYPHDGTPLIYANHFTFTLFENDSLSLIHSNSEQLSSHISFSVFNNDSLANFEVAQISSFTDRPNRPFENFEEWEALGFPSTCDNLIRDTLLYVEGWDRLNQPRFWQEIINMNNDSCLVSLSTNRRVVDKISTKAWQSWSDSVRQFYRDSIRQAYSIEEHEKVMITSGKKYFYDFEHALPSVSQGINIFTAYGTDPWYAQAILLIESPGKSRLSPVGASGNFQLMPEVALDFGLVVNDSIDEREDLKKAAIAAADFISDRCIPQTRRILRKYNVSINEEETWFRLLVLHVYHAGPGNVESAIAKIQPSEGGMQLIQKLWQTEAGGFKNASQNYSQLALASMIQFDQLLRKGWINPCNINETHTPEPFLAP